MGMGGLRAQRSLRIGTRKAADYIIMARLRDQALDELISHFPALTGMSSGEARELHVTLFGPFRSRINGVTLLARVEEGAGDLNRLTFRIGDLIRLKGLRGGAIAMSLEPDQEFSAFYQRLVSAFSPLTEWCTWIDTPPGHRIFHVSLRFNIPFRDFDLFWERTLGITPSQEYEPGEGRSPIPAVRTYLKACDSPVSIFRIAIMRRGSLWREYDLPQKTWLSRRESADTGEWERTYQTFRQNEGLELPESKHSTPSRQFLISDLHLGHGNIIHYCRRPFFSPDEMDDVLIQNWNNRVGIADEVFYLGDLCHGRDALPAAAYLARLNGTIHFIAGNHDEVITGSVTSMIIHSGSTQFCLIHDPAQAPLNFPGWVIHGHHHNNDLETYPFINARTRTVNISAELLDFIPISIDELCTILKQIKPGEKVGTLKEARDRIYQGQLPDDSL